MGRDSAGSAATARRRALRGWPPPWPSPRPGTASASKPSLHIAQAAQLLELLAGHALRQLGVGLELGGGRHLVPSVEHLREPIDHIRMLRGHVFLVERGLVEIE